MTQRYTWNSCCFLLFARWCSEKVSREKFVQNHADITRWRAVKEGIFRTWFIEVKNVCFTDSHDLLNFFSKVKIRGSKMKYCAHWIFLRSQQELICRMTKFVNFHITGNHSYCNRVRYQKILGSHCVILSTHTPLHGSLRWNFVSPL